MAARLEAPESRARAEERKREAGRAAESDRATGGRIGVNLAEALAAFAGLSGYWDKLERE